MNLHRIELDVLADNLQARHLFEKMGVVFEGTKRNISFMGGDYYDVCIYAILNEDYEIPGGTDLRLKGETKHV